VGVYRLWRDSGYAAGAIFAGLIADQFSLQTAVWATAGLTLVSGIFAAIRMRPDHAKPVAQ
jgi:predicted MFS family arabinose efflux permease